MLTLVGVACHLLALRDKEYLACQIDSRSPGQGYGARLVEETPRPSLAQYRVHTLRII